MGRLAGGGAIYTSTTSSSILVYSSLLGLGLVASPSYPTTTNYYDLLVLELLVELLVRVLA